MEFKRSEMSKILSQSKKADDACNRLVRLYLYKSVKDKRRDKFLLITFTVLGLAMVLYAPKETSRVAGVWIMFISSMLSILV